MNNEGEVTEIHYNNRTMGPLQVPSHLVTPFYHAYHVIRIYFSSSRLETISVTTSAIHGENPRGLDATLLPSGRRRRGRLQQSARVAR